MLDKIKTIYKSPTFKSLSDIRTLGVIAFGIIALLVTWSSVKVVQTNYDLQKQIAGMQQQNDVRELANRNMGLENEYYTTDAYLELAARRHFNKAAPGEKLVIVPKEIALAHSVELPAQKAPDQAASEAVKASSSSLQRNFDAWMNFLFHRQD